MLELITKIRDNYLFIIIYIYVIGYNTIYKYLIITLILDILLTIGVKISYKDLILCDCICKSGFH